MEDVPDRPARRKRARSTMITVDLGVVGRGQLDEVLKMLNEPNHTHETRTISYAVRAAMALLWHRCITLKGGIESGS